MCSHQFCPNEGFSETWKRLGTINNHGHSGAVQRSNMHGGLPSPSASYGRARRDTPHESRAAKPRANDAPCSLRNSLRARMSNASPALTKSGFQFSNSSFNSATVPSRASNFLSTVDFNWLISSFIAFISWSTARSTSTTWSTSMTSSATGQQSSESPTIPPQILINPPQTQPQTSNGCFGFGQRMTDH